MRGISKRYPGVQALDGVDLELRRGEILGLVGENGAGKSTLMKILAGAERRDAGEVALEGRPLAGVGPAEVRRLGVNMVYQEFNLVPSLTVAENVVLGAEPRTRLGFLRRREARERVGRLFREEIGVPLDPDVPVERLSVAERQMVEIGRALFISSRVLVLDEPSSALTPRELERLFAVLRRLASSGVGVIYISHRLAEVFEIASRVVVLRDGRTVAEFRIGGDSRELAREIVRAMVGRELSEEFPELSPPRPSEVLRVEGLSRRGRFEGISFSVRAGEVVGLAGLVGAGRTDVLSAIYGAAPAEEGRILLDGRPLRIGRPADALAAGIGLVAEDRARYGIVPDRSVRENVSLASLRSLSALGFVRRRLERERVGALARDLAVRAPSLETRIADLSGGNQQKALVARALLTRARVLLLDEPTRGVDVGARAELYALVARLVSEGAAVLLASSDLLEVLGMSHRILVFRAGRIVGELPRMAPTKEAQEKVMALAAGVGA
jgi:ribose transport system ATP-binding protein